MEGLVELFATLGFLLSINNMSGGAEWYTDSTIDPINDTRSALALRAETRGTWTIPGRTRLFALFCEERQQDERPDLSVVILWNIRIEDVLAPAGAEQWGESQETEIITRFGDAQAQSWTYGRARHGNGIFATSPYEVDRFLVEARDAPQIALRLENDVTGTHTTVFDLTGLTSVISAMEDGCAEPPDPLQMPQISQQQEHSPTTSTVDTPTEAMIAALPADDQAWIEDSCPRALGPASWSRCVGREVDAVNRGIPDIAGLAVSDQAWIEDSCPRVLGPASWSRCVGREVDAVNRGIPDIAGLAVSDQAWIEDSCPRVLGPASWSRCVGREVDAVNRGIPDIAGLAVSDQAWIEDSCPRVLGPASWSRCVGREVEAIRRIE